MTPQTRKKLNKKLDKLEIRAVRELRVAYGRVPEWERRFLAEEIEIQKKKAQIEQQLKLYEERIRKYTVNINNNLKFAIAYVKAHKEQGAIKFIEALIQDLLELQAMLSDMEETENVLFGLTEKQMQEFEEEMKYA